MAATPLQKKLWEILDNLIIPKNIIGQTANKETLEQLKNIFSEMQKAENFKNNTELAEYAAFFNKSLNKDMQVNSGSLQLIREDLQKIITFELAKQVLGHSELKSSIANQSSRFFHHEETKEKGTDTTPKSQPKPK